MDAVWLIHAHPIMLIRGNTREAAIQLNKATCNRFQMCGYAFRRAVVFDKIAAPAAFPRVQAGQTRLGSGMFADIVALAESPWLKPIHSFGPSILTRRWSSIFC